MARNRRSGILLHPTSLPGDWGIGDFGSGAVAALDWLAEAGQTLWQVLPLGPQGHGGSPYSATSAFAGSPLLISPELLAEEGLLPARSLDARPGFPPGEVDYPAVSVWKDALLRAAWQNVTRSREHAGLVEEARSLAEAPDFAGWLPDWSLYAALKRRFDGESWQRWPPGYRSRDAGSLAAARRELEDEIHFQCFCQLLWFRQWSGVQAAARGRGIGIVGDLPIYVGLDSADVWAHQELFDLDGEGRPNAIAGVPPDVFSPDGQSWGQPLYRWERLAETGFDWWIKRLRAALRTADLVRIDHFRGLAAYWRIPHDAESAREGAWEPGPGEALFTALGEALGELPLIAEDLGEITPDVRRLRRTLAIPGTRVLQFGFDDPSSEHLPHNLEREVFLYTGTHDNPTAVSWFADLDPTLRARVLDYTGGTAEEIHWALIRAASTSVARACLVPIQDLLGLDDRARMNRPAHADGNWKWRLDQLPDHSISERLARLTEAAGRSPSAPTPE